MNDPDSRLPLPHVAPPQRRPSPLVAPPPLHTPDSSSLYFRVWDMFICLKKRYVPIGVKSWGVNPRGAYHLP